MKIYIDTSTLVAYTVPVHPHRPIVVERFAELQEGDRLLVGLHVLAEYFATVTKQRLPYPMNAGLARKQIFYFSVPTY